MKLRLRALAPGAESSLCRCNRLCGDGASVRCRHRSEEENEPEGTQPPDPRHDAGRVVEAANRGAGAGEKAVTLTCGTGGNGNGENSEKGELKLKSAIA